MKTLDFLNCFRGGPSLYGFNLFIVHKDSVRADYITQEKEFGCYELTFLKVEKKLIFS